MPAKHFLQFELDGGDEVAVEKIKSAVFGNVKQAASSVGVTVLGAASVRDWLGAAGLASDSPVLSNREIMEAPDGYSDDD